MGFAAQIAQLLFNFRQRLKNYIAALQKNFTIEVQRLVVKELAQRTPRRTGRLANSYGARPGRGGDTVIFSKVNYSLAVQFKNPAYGGARTPREILQNLGPLFRQAAFNAQNKTNAQFGV